VWPPAVYVRTAVLPYPRCNFGVQLYHPCANLGPRHLRPLECTADVELGVAAGSYEDLADAQRRMESPMRRCPTRMACACISRNAVPFSARTRATVLSASCSHCGRRGLVP
jgi:hypothetical protein